MMVVKYAKYLWNMPKDNYDHIDTLIFIKDQPSCFIFAQD